MLIDDLDRVVLEVVDCGARRALVWGVAKAPPVGLECIGKVFRLH